MALQDFGSRTSKDRRTADAGLAALNHAARRLGELALPRPRKGRTRDLVGLLLAHGSRAWRASLPQARVRLRVETAQGLAAVRLAFG
ncbi:MAG: hypothetical protein IPL47_06550 [Phyllobacteriaceae bacterium]|nr:hypothetical protein [Phyllobacteriaceae bacterium]